MKRIDKIHNYVKESTKDLSEEALHLGKGITTKEIAEVLGIQRTNASKDLNALVRDGFLLKLDGRPVRYVDISVKWHRPFEKEVISYKENTLMKPTQPKSVGKVASSLKKNKNIFTDIIGVNGSMKVQIEQAKAAILYPPKGLNCLITGATGTGKTFFAHTMFEFARGHGLIHNKTGKLVIFNCADYAHNPELLMSHLFGYRKGAFTGADKDQDGLIHEADGGMLFLDEVHRLPPEGQEMIFYLMDHGLYSRLGETGKHSKASVRIVCATTENPESALLLTFVRRIPIIIQLPSFNERVAQEQILLLKSMISLEANRIHRRISLTEDAVKALIGSVSLGNIGQLKSNVQLVCARSFLNYMESDEVVIVLEDMPSTIKDGMVKLVSNRKRLKEISEHLEPRMMVVSGGSTFPIESDSYELPYNLYDIIGDKAALLKSEGMDQESINNFIKTDINIHLKSFYRENKLSFDIDSKLSEILDPKIIKITKEIFEYAKEKLQYPFQTNFLHAMGLHISSFLKQVELGQSKRAINVNIKNMVEAYPEELKAAKGIKRLLQDYYTLVIPEAEVYFLTILLVSLKAEKETGRIGVVVAAHGRSTATSMAEVVMNLLNVDNLRAVDMPLDMAPKIALEQMIVCVKEVDEGSGVIILVDMGSLATFKEEIEAATDIDVKIVDMVTTPIVLEAARKTAFLETTLSELYDSIRKFRGYVGGYPADHHLDSLAIDLSALKTKAIIAICASGEGTAKQIKRVLDEYLMEHFDEEIQVIPVSVVNLDTEIMIIEEEFQIIGATGVMKPTIEVPFISLDVLFSGKGQHALDALIESQQLDTGTNLELTEESAKKICEDYMTDSFTFINPKKLITPLWQFFELVTKGTVKQDEYPFGITLTMHMAGLLERVLKNDTLVSSDLSVKLSDYPQFDQVMKGIYLLEDTLYLRIPEEELYYVLELLNS